MYQVTAGSERARTPGMGFYLAASVVTAVLSRQSLASWLPRTWSKKLPANQTWAAAKKTKEVFLWIWNIESCEKLVSSKKPVNEKLKRRKTFDIFTKTKKISDLTSTVSDDVQRKSRNTRTLQRWKKDIHQKCNCSTWQVRIIKLQQPRLVAFSNLT